MRESMSIRRTASKSRELSETGGSRPSHEIQHKPAERERRSLDDRSSFLPSRDYSVTTNPGESAPGVVNMGISFVPWPGSLSEPGATANPHSG